MPDPAMIGTAAIVLAAGYWLDTQDALERVLSGVTADRMLTAGGFGAGVVFGPMALEVALGFVGGLGTLAIGDAIGLSSTQLAIAVAAVVAVLLFTGGD